MKRIVLLLLLATLSISMRSQTVTIPSSIDDVNLYQYVVGDSNRYYSKNLKEFYQRFSFGGDYVQDEEGNWLPFYSWISCVNYLTLQGWQLYDFSLTNDWDNNVYSFRRIVSREEAQAILKGKPLSPCTHPALGTAPVDEDNLYLYAIGTTCRYEVSKKQTVSGYSLYIGATKHYSDYQNLLKDEEGNVIDFNRRDAFISYLTLQDWRHILSFGEQKGFALYRRKVSPEEAKTLMKKMIRQEE